MVGLMWWDCIVINKVKINKVKTIILCLMPNRGVYGRKILSVALPNIN